MAKYIVKPSQNIFDIALHLYGTIEGVFDLLITNPWLNMNTDLITGTELEYHEMFMINEPVVNKLKEDGIVPANSERHIYYKAPSEELVAVCDISPLLPMAGCIVGGEGTLIIDWGDNSSLEHIRLSHTNQTVKHYFDNNVEYRRIRFYGDATTMKFTYLNITELGGGLLVTRPIVVDEYVSYANGFTLSGLFLFTGTYSVDLQRCTVSSLLPVADKNLQELNLTDVRYVNKNVLDEYLQYIVANYGTRRGCTVHLTTEPSAAGWEAIRTILSEPEWNTPSPWKFIINGVTYTYTA